METAWVCVSVLLTSPEEMPFLAAGGSASAVGVPSFACCLATSKLLQSKVPPVISQAGRQAGSVLGASSHPHPSPKLQTPTSLCLVPRPKREGNKRPRRTRGVFTRSIQNISSLGFGNSSGTLGNVVLLHEPFYAACTTMSRSSLFTRSESAAAHSVIPDNKLLFCN